MVSRRPTTTWASRSFPRHLRTSAEKALPQKTPCTVAPLPICLSRPKRQGVWMQCLRPRGRRGPVRASPGALQAASLLPLPPCKQLVIGLTPTRQPCKAAFPLCRSHSRATLPHGHMRGAQPCRSSMAVRFHTHTRRRGMLKARLPPSRQSQVGLDCSQRPLSWCTAAYSLGELRNNQEQ